ncbi:MAG TPA: tRNA (adenosine(37)-N6)-threonylcarbamoyltransferase complex ATPase subunit type 1 TsaE [Saprospiraceae bacterium]|nr:tRNA (adenosine(37)-N6)-threonylcarbamoyltransferase complex ATPase subunit type 1 TsaE [Saprospiraceae bacterium]HQV66841.1 tRNA (adenosine(37)-N6)-threonylcarbamoyltransferase complex ATPase subunit type 1 TsaE [Saprospiraceae bacterium]HQV97916.1 tRNA (adenosine(37)-N6)-threonylcarbamoyltransferase complex ATPase subunit type 1 TsaE [Saprospiraceae bacterium]
MEKFIFRSESLDDLEQLSDEILMTCTKSQIFTFEGQLGAGKTTLIKSLCQYLGYTDEVTSPTFSLVNEYQTPSSMIYHMDLYRLNSENELLDIGFEEYLDGDAFCFIEWPQIAENLIVQSHYKIKILLNEDLSRKIEIDFVS